MAIDHPHVALLQRLLEAFAARDVEALAAALAADVRWHTPGTSPVSAQASTSTVSSTPSRRVPRCATSRSPRIASTAGISSGSANSAALRASLMM